MAGKFSPKALTLELRKLSEQAISVTDDGTPVTRAQILAEHIWKIALGYAETIKDVDGKLIEKKYPPVAWAMQYLYERLEGKAPIAISENETGIRAADKVRALARDRFNKVAVTVSGPPKHSAKSDG